MFSAISLLIVSAVAIYVACTWFINAVEWLGSRLKMGSIAIGSVLAAVGTALPESVVTFVAVVLGDTPASKEVGVGAAMGGPLVLSTLAYATIGVVLALTSRSLISRPAGGRNVVGDQTWFLVIFALKVALGVLVFSWKPWLGWAFLVAYVVFVVLEVRQASCAGAHRSDELDRLRLQPSRSVPAGWAIGVQTAGTLAVIFVASQVFVAQLENLGPDLGLSPAVVALLFAPVATELPEILNAVIWVRQGKTELAMANIAGSMMIQATIPSALGIGFTPWHFDSSLLIAGTVTLAAVALLMLLGRLRRLTAGALLGGFGIYAGFLTAVLIVN
ncbi:sodium:calcium antiporter [Nakamurella antarctica]|uniref:Sodium:calcium antiporter n=1 Tax=Nakamurella antarctica TaxID=1902245 RepID=A0A3G8ZYG2_9ACTN|nr:sodium:calcium antiporter [Nakamurella antarctica]AZI58621.1 sodium:calcium antiporter [Nakamurella antarctica]